MSSSLHIRQYQPVDKSRVLELHEQAMREVGSFVEGVPDSDLENIEQAYLDTGGEFLVGEIDSQIIAMGAFRPAEGYITEFLEDLPDATAELKRMRVAPEYQQMGYGQQIYRTLEQRALESGFTDFVLDTTPKQIGAQRLYEKNSFTEVRRERVEFNDDSFILVLYRKSLIEDTGSDSKR